MIWPFKPRFKKQIARIDISGVIAASTRKRVLEAFKQIEERRFPAVVVRIDSPGGTVADSQEIYQAMKRLQSKCKIIASFGNIAASGGVYVGMGAEHIISNPGTITGSIGVILRGNNLERLLDKIGVSFKVVKSGPYKDILAFDRELTEPEQHILQEMIDTSYQQFVDVVSQARNLAVDAVRTFADGRVFTGQQALQFGVVDRLGTEEDARCWAAEMVGLDPEKAPFYTIKDKKNLVNRLTGNRQQVVLPASLHTAMEWLEFEMETEGLPLWLYRP